MLSSMLRSRTSILRRTGTGCLVAIPPLRPWQQFARRCQSTDISPELTRSDRNDDHTSTHRVRRPLLWQRAPKYLAISPNRTLALRVKTRTAPLTYNKWRMFRHVARSRSLRLPVVTLQAMVRREEAGMNTSLSECLCDPAEWRRRLSSLAYKGITEQHIDHWVWILSAENGDARIERLVEKDVHKPIFLLYQTLRRDETLKKGTSIMSVCNYVAQHYCRHSIPSIQTKPLPWGAIRRSLDNRLNMTPRQFATLLRLLVYHCIRVWPSSLVTVARLVAQYTQSIPADSNSFATSKQHMSRYQAQCFVFNYALQLFESAPRLRPLAQAKYNWRAQKILLSMSTAMAMPLVINHMSYRAIRRVMLRLRKSPAEQKVATRLTKTWPPYRQEWDGLDERRRPEDDLSRSVRAGVLMREAGYADCQVDNTLGVLGGAVPDEAPTVQTRSMSPKLWKGRYANQNLYSTWAAKVQTTRNAQEAWTMFRSPPTDGLKPNFEVYAEMFKKLFAREVHTPSTTVPGDGVEVFPVHDTNLSQFEKARLKPPNPHELYQTMIRDGLRPVGHCLAVLIRYAPTVQAAEHYLRDSPLDKKAVNLLTSQSVDLAQPGIEAVGLLRKIPLPILNAFVALLCRLQPRWMRDAGNQRRPATSRIGYLERAVQLTSIRLSPVADEARDYKGPWHIILNALARSDIVVDPRGDLNPERNATMALSTFLDVFTRVKETAGFDVVLFEQLCRVLHKVVKSKLLNEGETQNSSSSFLTSESVLFTTTSTWEDRNPVIHRAHMALKSAFREITKTTCVRMDDGRPEHPALYHEVTANHLQAYIRTLGFLGDIDEMIFVMDWMMQAWGKESILEAAKNPDDKQHDMMSHALTFFRAFAEHHVSADVMQRLEERLQKLNEENGCTWFWPTIEDVEAYVEADRSRDADKFWSMVKRRPDILGRGKHVQLDTL